MVVAVWFVTPAHACAASLLISNTKALRSSFQSCQLVWGSLCLAEGRGFGVKHSELKPGAAWLPLLLPVTPSSFYSTLPPNVPGRKPKTPEKKNHLRNWEELINKYIIITCGTPRMITATPSVLHVKMTVTGNVVQRATVVLAPPDWANFSFQPPV